MGTPPPSEVGRGAALRSPTGFWRRRRARALELIRRTPHADRILDFYVGLVELQEEVAAKTPGVVAGGPSGGGEPAGQAAVVESAVVEPEGLRQPGTIGDVPGEALESLFSRFLRGLEEIGTAEIADGARTLLQVDPGTRVEALERFWRERDPADFLCRVFGQPVAWALVREAGGTPYDEPEAGGSAAAGGGRPSGLRRRCPACGSPPQAGMLRDDPGALGRRLLVCALCASAWGFPRLTCANCGLSEAERLGIHQPESLPHIRVEECRGCGRYLKTVDLREDGAAEPVVDDVATPELDLWASERGLEKVHPNVFGL